MLRRPLHSVRPSHCPDSRNEQHKRPTLNDIYLIIYSSHGAFAVAFDPDYPLEVAKFYRVKVKALSKRLFSVCHPTHPTALAAHHQRETGAKLRIISEICKKLGRIFHFSCMKSPSECMK